ncbi:ABC transporter permease [Streptomonospora wellingtoniae]|uniref:Oligopeptide transport system permease protein OppC n=1 Tax=Streptomonospora wellingtoniae TaxID=3075544 RepID=A0ABU2KXS6_9ACTN|nr:ABC transporter permease [Streptomonospora sp. DSM 45055]MDT0304104.1 ABC transporter permease [Streptomonospora sp. DSM 45055]
MSLSAEREAITTEAAAEISGRWSSLAKELLATRRVVIGLAIILGLIAAAWIGPMLSPWGFGERDFTAFRSPPSADHWFGTGNTGRDIFHMTMVGLQKSILIGLCAALFTTVIAALVGAFAGYYLGITDRALMWVTDLFLVLPQFLILAILYPVLRDSGWLIFVLLLGCLMWMVTAKMVRGMTISLKEREYVLAARYMGVSHGRIILRHILPNMSSLLIVDATINVSSAIILETALSYFGFGIQPPDVTLGSLIAEGSRQALAFPWTFWFCTGLLIVLVLAVNLIGDGLRDALDPHSKSRT